MFNSTITSVYAVQVRQGFNYFLALFLTLVITGCGSSQERPKYNEPDTVGAVSADAFVGTWRYTVLNPAVPEENDIQTVYTFNADGTFVGLSKPKEITMETKSTGTWKVAGDSLIISVEKIEELSGDPIASLAVAITKGLIRKQTGTMNPYAISQNQIVISSTQNDMAIRLDRI